MEVTAEERPVFDAVAQFLRSATHDQKKDIIAAHPALLTEPAWALLRRVGREFRATGDEAMARSVEAHAELLQRCARIGVEHALIGQTIMNSLDEIYENPDAIPERFPELLRSEADESLRLMAEDMRASGSPEAAELFGDLRERVAHVRRGLDAAVALPPARASAPARDADDRAELPEAIVTAARAQAAGEEEANVLLALARCDSVEAVQAVTEEHGAAIGWPVVRKLEELEGVARNLPGGGHWQALAETVRILTAYLEFRERQQVVIPEALRADVEQWQKLAAAGNPSPATRDAALAVAERLLASPGEGDLPEYLRRKFGLKQAPADDPGKLPQDLRRGIAGWAAGTYLDRFQADKEPADLDRAIFLYSVAADLTSQRSPGFANYTAYGGTALLWRFKQGLDLTDLTMAVVVLRSAVAAALLAPGPEFEVAAGSLLECLLVRGRVGTDEDDTETALKVCELVMRRARETKELPQPALIMALLILGAEVPPEQEGGKRVRQALEALEQHVLSGVEGMAGSVHARYLHGLGEFLRAEYERGGNSEVLERAIVYFQKGLGTAGQATAPFHDALGIALKLRYLLRGEPGDIAGAVRNHQAAVDFLTPSTGGKPGVLYACCLDHLGSAVRYSYWESGDVTVLDRAVEASARACEIFRVARGGWIEELVTGLMNLASSYESRYGAMGKEADLAQAIECYDEALTRAASGAARQKVLVNYAPTRLARAVKTGDAEELARARALFAQVTRDRPLAPVGGFNLGLSWCQTAFDGGAWADAADGYELARSALQELAFSGEPARAGKEGWLGTFQWAVGNAAYALAKLGRLEDAVTALEGGIALLLWESAETRDARLASLVKAGRGELVDRFRQARERAAGVRARQGQSYADARAAAEEFRAVVREVQQVPGMEAFLARPTFEAVHREADAGTGLAYVLCTRQGGLVLLDTGGGVRALWLDGLSEVAVTTLNYGDSVPAAVRGATRARRVQLAHAGGWFGAYWRYRTSPAAGAGAEWLATLDDVTGRLWPALMGPLLTAADDAGCRALVLIPVAHLAWLPLGAAWSPDAGRPTGRVYASDRLLPTCAPSVLLLRGCREAVRTAPAGSVLAVGDPRPSAHPPLGQAVAEIRDAAARFARSQVLLGEQATRADVLAALAAGHEVWHFACHSFADQADPWEGGLILASDERVTLNDLERAVASAPRLVVLSSCESGVSGYGLPTEKVSLSGAFLRLGAGGVVATYWPVADLDALTFIARFYEYWRTDGLPPPAAVSRSQAWVRDTTNAEKAEFFARLHDQPAGPGRPAAAWLHVCWGVQDPEERNSAHPTHWAGFHYAGL
jgi:hypothetical protein